MLDDLTFTRVIIGDKPHWRASDGTTFPVVSGGDGDGGEEEEEEQEEEELDEENEPDELAKAKADADKWKKLARKHETNAKANRKAADELKKRKNEGLDENERAVAEAEERGRQAASAEFAQQLAGARVEAALTGVVDDPAAIVEDLNLAKYVTDDSEIDTEAIDALRTKYTALAGGKNDGDGDGAGDKPTTKPDLKQGSRGGGRNGAKPQLKREDLASMSSDEIVAAKADGRLNDVLGIKT